MIKLYGIPNCETVKKARAWLEARGVEYDFHDMLEHPSGIKRPVLVDGTRTLGGFKPEAYEAAFPRER